MFALFSVHLGWRVICHRGDLRRIKLTEQKMTVTVALTSVANHRQAMFEGGLERLAIAALHLQGTIARIGALLPGG